MLEAEAEILPFEREDTGPGKPRVFSADHNNDIGCYNVLYRVALWILRMGL
jgi:hypothetical protein